MQTNLAQKLLRWYHQHQRSFPWREDPDPYPVWISEIMAQQTRLETMLPYFQRWMARFPSIAALAEASQQEVLNMWEGLGYYSRARNLHRAAKTIMESFNGQLPATRSELETLPGIGRYTAGAIASIAFGQDEAVVDGNVKRVYARLFQISDPINTPAVENRIWALAESQLPHGQAGDYNQALMDLGATICLPRQPLCQRCPLSGECQAFQNNLTAELPVKKQTPSSPHHTVTAAVLHAQNGQVLIAQRPQEALLGSLWEFPGGKRENGESLKACLKREILEELQCTIKIGEKLGIFKHAYTHFKVTLHAYHCELVSDSISPQYHQEVRWVNISDLGEYPMGKIDRLISQQLQEHNTPWNQNSKDE
ncbi:MAG TPA: A/G-specific adenine glycosylase [Chloroflexi bacterium]|nr:A/G-specific adenine glycosylase [Chloroflexota bacterium]